MDADIGMFRYNPDDQTFHFSDALVSGAGRCRRYCGLEEVVKDLHPDDIERTRRCVSG